MFWSDGKLQNMFVVYHALLSLLLDDAMYIIKPTCGIIHLPYSPEETSWCERLKLFESNNVSFNFFFLIKLDIGTSG